ncbi:MAG TPA: nucleoside phosphorylase, partial [Chryseosolibacter sp.]
MATIGEGDLILNNDGSVYHLSLLPQHLSDTILTVGDPGRVNMISKFFDSIEFEMNRREFITQVGTYKGKRITVISTGIGTDNIEIFFTEIDALVNIDLKTREPKARRKKLNILRIGTSGALQEDIPNGSHLLSDYAVGFDNLMTFYDLPQDDVERAIGADIGKKVGLPVTPYVVRGSETMLKKYGGDMIVGNTVTTPGFYAPQGRVMRIPIKYPRLLQDLNGYHHQGAD